MAHYDITYTCGHADRVNLIGPHRARASRIAYLESGPCFECHKTEQHQVARAQAEEMDLPALVGTEKQVAWAETLRVTILAKIEAEVAAIEAQTPADYTPTDADRAVLRAVAAISAETSAKQWIEWRYDAPSQIIRTVYRARMAQPTAAEVQAKQAAQRRAEAANALALAEATVRPATPITATVAEIRVAGQTLSVIFPEKREDFRAVVKGLGYAWENGCWQRTIGRFAGTVTDRAAEVGHALLTAGFAVCILDDTIRAAAMAGTYASECTRWVTMQVAGEYAGWFTLTWGRDEDYYAAARRIPGTRYHAPAVVVPPAQFEQWLDFAARYDFALSDAAGQAVATARAAKDAQLVVQPAPRKRARAVVVPGDVPPVLVVPESVDIAPELQDN